MPIIVENIKNYFETLHICINGNKNHDINKKADIKHTEINRLFTDVSVAKAIAFVNTEFKNVSTLPSQMIKRNVKQYISSMELMVLIYQTHGFFSQQLSAIKYMRNLCKLNLDLEELNYVNATEAFWYFIHDTKSFIPSKCVEICQRIIINKNLEKNKQQFVVQLAKLIFSKQTNDPIVLFNKINEIKKDYRSYFERSSLDSLLTKCILHNYVNAFKTKAFNMGVWNDDLNFIEDALLLRKVSLRAMEYLKTRYSNLKLHSGSYETLFYLWSFINHLMNGLHMLTEYYTLIGIEKESKQYQYEFFIYSVQYCIPYKTKIAIRLLMHDEFIYLRLPELAIRLAQLDQIKNPLETVSINIVDKKTIGPEIAEYHYGLQPMEKEYFNNSISKSSIKNTVLKSHVLCIKTTSEKDVELALDDCFILKSTFRIDLQEMLDIVKSYIWKVQDSKLDFFDDNEWTKHFIEPLEDEETLVKEMGVMNLSTPPNSPTKFSSPANKINAPPRIKQADKKIKRPMILRNDNSQFKDDSEGNPIERFDTFYMPDKVRNIKFEEPELPRSTIHMSKDNVSLNCANVTWPIHSFDVPTCNRRFTKLEILSLQDTNKVDPTVQNKTDGPSLIEYLENHVVKFKYLNIPVIHRPIYQRLALHYLSINNEKHSFYTSLAINIGFRQLYVTECQLKGLNKARWNSTRDIVNQALKNETEFHTTLENVLPNNWTVIQFTMIDEIQIPGIKSSLLNNVDGGCMGARNCAVLLATKYQKTEVDGQVKLTIETRVLHGFRKTGLQLLSALEEVKNEAASGLKITDRKDWWSKRYSADSNLKTLTNQMRFDWFTNENTKWLMDEDNPLEIEPKILIADRNISRVPLECLLNRDTTKPRCITRMPNMFVLIGHLHQTMYRNVEVPQTCLTRSNLEIDPLKTFFLVNPDDTLQETEDAILPLFQKTMNWEGLAGKSAKSMDSLNILSSKDMLIYCGHGSGYRYLMDKSKKFITSPSSVLLMGCQSARFIIEGRSEAFGLIMYYLTIGCPSVLGLLWDVTDREIDKYTVKFISNWVSNVQTQSIPSETYQPKAPMPYYVFDNNSTERVQLKSLTGNAAIICGLPTWLTDSTKSATV